MTQEEKRQDLLKRVEEAKRYIRDNYFFEWEPQLKATKHTIEAVDAFMDYKEYDEAEDEIKDGDQNIEVPSEEGIQDTNANNEEESGEGREEIS